MVFRGLEKRSLARSLRHPCARCGGHDRAAAGCAPSCPRLLGIGAAWMYLQVWPPDRPLGPWEVDAVFLARAGLLTVSRRPAPRDPRRTWVRRLDPRTPFLAVLLALLPAGTALAQFGQNKVQYRSFDWRILETEH